MKVLLFSFICYCLFVAVCPLGLKVPGFGSSSSENSTSSNSSTSGTSSYLKSLTGLVSVNTSSFSLPGFSDNSSIWDSFPKLKLNTSSIPPAPIPDVSQLAEGCYEGLGCFNNTAPWFSVLRPFPKPMSPQAIDTKVYLYTSNKPKERFTVQLWDNISLEGSDFDPNRQYTAFITHGFSSNGNVSWVEDLKDAYLKKREANVFIVDWGKGASVWNYLQVAANTRVVGAEVARFGKYIVEQKGQDPSKMHLMGHSLGAHISSYLAKAVPGVAELTAFDPAQPGFEGCPDDVRLNKNDAEFVSAIHTNTRPVIPFLGFGLIFPTADIDYYMNGGMIQPGCYLPPFDEIKLNGISDLGKFSVDVISSWVACSHGKSYLYYTEALANDYCTFWGLSSGVLGTLTNIATFGTSSQIKEKYSSCTLEKCSPIGLESKEYPARGVFYVTTHSGSPYCQSDPKTTKSMQELRARKLEADASGSTTTTEKSGKTFFKKFTG